MLAVDIPGFGRFELDHLVLDYNGTLALDGRLVPGLGPARPPELLKAALIWPQ
jgi:hypothetical protein